MPALARAKFSKVPRSPELALQICLLIAQGFSLRYACSELGLPLSSTSEWLLTDETVHAQYARAREQQAEVHADELIELADSATPITANAVRLQVDTRKWIAAKLLPKKYGDNQAGVTINNNILVIAEDKRAQLMERRKALTQGSTGQVQG